MVTDENTPTPTSIQAAACQLLLRDLTEAEWQTYLPNLPYRATCSERE